MRAAVARSFLLKLLLVALALVLAFTVVGLVAYWPSGSVETTLIGSPPTIERATVEAVTLADCRAPGRVECARVTARLRSGPDKGKAARFTVGETSSDVRLAVGDRIRVYRLALPEGTEVLGQELDRYGFSDFERQRPLAILAILFCLLVVVSSRLRGVRALIGLGLSLAIVIGFVVPAILDGHPAVGVALVGALAVMFVTIPLAHGLGAKGIAAILGTSVSLGLTAFLASVASDAAHLTGLSSDETSYLRAITGELSLHGLLLAGMIIGALGVLDDLTVSQASTVMALRKANDSLGVRELIRSALDVGHDHIAATVNTLVLAYAGAALPTLLLFSLADTSFGTALNSEAVAGEVVAMLVGSTGLIAAVPITTALAALLATKLPAATIEADVHGHAH